MNATHQTVKTSKYRVVIMSSLIISNEATSIINNLQNLHYGLQSEEWVNQEINALVLSISGAAVYNTVAARLFKEDMLTVDVDIVIIFFRQSLKSLQGVRYSEGISGTLVVAAWSGLGRRSNFLAG